MALFDIFKKDKKRKSEQKLTKRPSKGALKMPPLKEKTSGEKKVSQEGAREGQSELASLTILSPHITEKSSLLSEGGVYVFRVAANANKSQVWRAVKELYGLNARKVGITNIPSKKKMHRNRVGWKSGYKKATVYLKKGEKIDIT